MTTPNEPPARVGPAAYIIAALIGATAIIVAALLSNQTLVERVFGVLEYETDEITIYVDLNSSGAAIYLGGDGMLAFAQTVHSALVAVGDTGEDQFVKTFLTFSLDNIRRDAVIQDARFDFSCDVSGTPELLGTLQIAEFGFGQYEQTDFINSPNGWMGKWTNTEQAVNDCRQNKRLSLELKSLVPVIQKYLDSGSPVQFVMYFEGDSRGDLIIPNQSVDAIMLSEPPSLYIRYEYPKP